MKLLELLVKELPELGGWPDGYLYAAQDGDSGLFFYESEPKRGYGVGFWLRLGGNCTRIATPLKHIATDHTTAIITREQYEAALAAKTEPAAWDGEWLPPVGTVCEYTLNSGVSWWVCRIEYVVGSQGVVMSCDVDEGVQFVSINNKTKFRPIRTPEQIEAERREKITREQFEIYAEEIGFDLSFYFFDDDNSYSDEQTLFAFEIYKAAWQASRAVEIELPDYVGADTHQSAGYNLAIDHCVEAIEKAGFKIKGE